MYSTLIKQISAIHNVIQVRNIHGCGTIISVASVEITSSDSVELKFILVFEPKSPAANAIIVSVFPRPMGSATIPP
jgi:hypothetical protein